jgi:hypothetical protein
VLKELNLKGNQLCGLDMFGRGIYTAEGITKLCEGLKGSAVTSLDLANNQLCGVNSRGQGTYSAEGITKLCEGLKGSAVTSLRCAATPKCLLLCQRPLTRLLSLAVPTPHPPFAVSLAIRSVTRVYPRSLPCSRRRRSPSSSAPPL